LDRLDRTRLQPLCSEPLLEGLARTELAQLGLIQASADPPSPDRRLARLGHLPKGGHRHSQGPLPAPEAHPLGLPTLLPALGPLGPAPTAWPRSSHAPRHAAPASSRVVHDGDAAPLPETPNVSPAKGPRDLRVGIDSSGLSMPQPALRPAWCQRHPRTPCACDAPGGLSGPKASAGFPPVAGAPPSPWPRPGRSGILSLSTFEPRKNLQTLLEAFEQLQ
jgi:hypothetical protein